MAPTTSRRPRGCPSPAAAGARPPRTTRTLPARHRAPPGARNPGVREHAAGTPSGWPPRMGWTAGEVHPRKEADVRALEVGRVRVQRLGGRPGDAAVAIRHQPHATVRRLAKRPGDLADTDAPPPSAPCAAWCRPGARAERWTRDARVARWRWPARRSAPRHPRPGAEDRPGESHRDLLREGRCAERDGGAPGLRLRQVGGQQEMNEEHAHHDPRHDAGEHRAHQSCPCPPGVPRHVSAGLAVEEKCLLGNAARRLCEPRAAARLRGSPAAGIFPAHVAIRPLRAQG